MRAGRTGVLSIAVAAVLIVPVLVMSGCATPPMAPTVAVMPPPGKSFEQFQEDDLVCRHFAQTQLGTNPANVSHQQEAAGAIGGAALGAVAGSLIGGGHQGAGIGAGMGLLAGSVVGAGSAGQSEQSMQRTYDIAYEQCMYSKGNELPSAGYGYRRRKTVIVMPPNNAPNYQQPPMAPPPPPTPGYGQQPPPPPSGY